MGEEDITITLLGAVPEGTPLTHYVNSEYFFGSQIPKAGALESTLGFDPANGDYLGVWRNNDWVMYDYINGVWKRSDNGHPEEPNIQIGEGIWLGLGNSRDWEQSLSHCSGQIPCAPPHAYVWGLTSGTFTLGVNGFENSTWTVSSSENLVDWTPRGTVVLSPSQPWPSFTDSQVSSLSFRFYRLSNGECCSRTVGFYRTTIQTNDWALIGLPFDVTDTYLGNTLLDIFLPVANGVLETTLPTGTEIAAPDNTSYFWNDTTKNWSGSGDSVTLTAGDGFAIHNVSEDPITITLLGAVPEGTPLTHYVNSGYFFGSQIPKAGALESTLGFDPANGDYLGVWRNNDWVMYDYIGGIWKRSDNGHPEEPNIQIGEGIWLGLGNSRDWEQSLSLTCP